MLSGNIMGKHRFRKYLDEGLFVLLIMAAAIAAAALEAGAVLGGLPGSSVSAFATFVPGRAEPAQAAASAPPPVAGVRLARVAN
jgi:VanZ family protein